MTTTLNDEYCDGRQTVFHGMREFDGAFHIFFQLQNVVHKVAITVRQHLKNILATLVLTLQLLLYVS